MKFLLVFFFTLTFLSAKAQSYSDETFPTTIKAVLTPEEFKVAKDKYVVMAKSDTYIAFEESLRENSAKLGDANYPDDLKTNDRDEVEKWLKESIQDTKFSSIEEGVEMITKSSKLMSKLYSENIELYTFMRRASREQLKAIIAPEHKTLDNLMEDSLKH